MRWLITGASGFIGSWTAAAAVEAGHSVRTLVRNVEKARAALPASVEILEGDLTDAATLGRALEGMDVVLPAAANYRYGRDVGEKEVQETVALTRSVLSAAERAGTPHVIDLSSNVVFAPHPEGAKAGVTDLDSPLWSPGSLQRTDPYLRSKVLAYQDSLNARERGLPISIVHPTLVVGPRDSGPGTSGVLLRRFTRERLWPDTGMAWTDVRDVADAIVGIAGRPPGAAYIVSVGVVRFRDIAAIVDAETGVKRSRVFAPRSVIDAGLRLNDVVGGRLVPQLPPRSGMVFMLNMGPSVDGATGAEVLGRPYRPFAETIRDTFTWWAANGLISAKEAGTLASH